MRDFSTDHSMLALNTATLGSNVEGHGSGWTPEQIIDACAERGIGAITWWRRELGTRALEIGNRTRSAGLQVSGLCRSPFLIGPLAPPSYQAVMDDFRASIDTAASLGSPSITVCVGGIVEHTHSMTESLKRATALIAEALPHARACKVLLALEPLNPVYGGNRSCLVTVRDAIDICEALNEPQVGIAIDVYHVWWDTTLAEELKRVNTKRIAGYHLCDWLADTNDVLLDRGMMGDGVADLKRIRTAVEATGYRGYCEVEIFSAKNWWKQPPPKVLDTCIERFRAVC